MFAILKALVGSAIAGYVSTYIPFMEFRLFFLGFALFVTGVVAGRRMFLGSLGFVGAYLGAFIGFYLSEQLFWYSSEVQFLWFSSYMEPLALVLALAAGAGGLMMGKVGIHRLDRALRHMPGVRRCSSCGARVGPSAHKCWSCKATLTY